MPDDIAMDQRRMGLTPRVNAERALKAVREAYPGEVSEALDIADLGDICYEQVADLITECLLLIDLAGEDVGRALDGALTNYYSEKD